MLSQAHEKVLGTPELLEQILGELSMGEILLVQRTCRYFKNTVKGSLVLQKRLYFKGHPKSYTEVGKTLYNPLLQKHFPNFFQDEARFPPHKAVELAPWTQEPGRALATYVLHERPIPYGLTLPILNIPDTFQKLPWYQDSCRRKAFTRPDASWRRMLTIQPPINVLELQYVARGCFHQIDRGYWWAGEGITMGPLYDIVWRWIFEDYPSSFCRSFALTNNKVQVGLEVLSPALSDLGMDSTDTSSLILYRQNAMGLPAGRKFEWSRMIKSEAFNMPQIESRDEILSRRLQSGVNQQES